MTDGRYIDFDKFQSETSEQPVKLRFRGKVYDLAPELPAALALEVQRAMPETGGRFQVNADQVERWSRLLFGQYYKEIVEESGIGVQALTNLISAVIGEYGADPAPKRAARRDRAKRPRSTSSKTGRGSKPTSSANTG